MNKVEKIRREIEKRYEYWKEKESNSHSIESESRMSECQHLLLLFNSLQEEPVSNDLEEACDEYYNETWDEHGGKAMVVDGCHDIWFPSQATDDFFKAGARWQKKQMMKNSAFINEVEWEDDIHKLFREKGKKVKLMIVEEE